ncbi:uncharacterized protein [Triticum aestivum]|nr:uncharacterized protein LOC123147484 [Triticum aestivum]
MVDRESDTYSCECAMFEHMGILCRHALKVMVHVGVCRIPSHYILKRWSRDARDVLPDHLKCYQKDSDLGVSKTFRHNILYVRALQVVKLGNMSVPLFNHAVQRLLALEKELNAMAEEEAENKSAGLCGSETLRCTSPATLSEEIPNSGAYAGEAAPPDLMSEPVDVPLSPQRMPPDLASDPVDAPLPPQRRPSRGRPKSQRMKSVLEHIGKKPAATYAVCGSEEHHTEECECMQMPERGDSSEDSEPEHPDPAPSGSCVRRAQPMRPNKRQSKTEASDVCVSKTAAAPWFSRGTTQHHGLRHNGASSSANAIDRTPKMKPPAPPRRCSVCGEKGHYKSSCPDHDAGPKPAQTRRCKKCGIGKHNSRTCIVLPQFKRPRRGD